jgi:hypothetical protein
MRQKFLGSGFCCEQEGFALEISFVQHLVTITNKRDFAFDILSLFLSSSEPLSSTINQQQSSFASMTLLFCGQSHRR